MPPTDEHRRRRKRRRKTATLHLQPPPPPTTTDNLALLDDVLLEILVRLPAKSLIRFKSVCKSWLSLISSDHFCHQHTLRRPKLQPSFILDAAIRQYFYLIISNPTINTVVTKMVPYIMSPRYQKIHQACNGLLLLKSDYNPATKQYRRHPKYHVYNPTTRQSREITLANNKKCPYVASIHLAFDHSKSPYYKIVCIRCNKEPVWYKFRGFNKREIYQGEVYDSERHTWRVRLVTFTGIRRPTCLHSDGVYWNNAIYWRMNIGIQHYYFDIDNIQIKTTSSPSILQCVQKSRNICRVYYFNKLHEDVDEDEDEDEDEEDNVAHAYPFGEILALV